MDTLSSLFSKKFKKDPALLQFHGINEDLYEGKKLISKRQRTKNKIAKKSPLLEGFANQLDDLTISEDQETANLNADLQRNLSSYATSLKNVVSDYVVARKQEKSCKQKCNNLRPDKAGATAKPLIYGINTAEEIYTKDSQGSEGGWRMPSSGARLQNVSATGKTHIWGVNSGNAIYKCKRPCLGGAWEQVPGGLTQLSADDQYVYGVASDDTIWRMNEDGTGNWERLPGGLTNISASGKDWVWGVNRNGNVYRCAKPCSGSWIEDDGILKQAAADDNNVWGVKSNREIWKKPVNGSGTWERIPRGGLLWVSPSAPNYVWGVGSDRRMWYCEKPCTDGNWKTKGIFGDATQVEADNGKNAAAAAAAAQASAANQNTERKDACLAGCKLSDAYLEKTAATTPTYNNEAIGDCGAVAPSPTACGPCAYMHWYWSRATQEQQCGAQGPCCKFNESFWGNTCNPTGAGSWCPNPPCSNSAEGAARLEACENSKNENQQALSSGMDGRNLTQEYSDLNSRYLSDNQCNSTDVTGCTTCQSCYAQGPGYWCSDTGRCSTHGNPCTGGCGGGGYQVSPEPGNVLLADGSSIDGRIKNILSRRQELNTTNNNERQNLVNTLNIYKGALKNLQKNEQGTTTLNAMTEDGHLKRNSANFKYYIWLGLAICGLMIAIRQLKK